MFFPFTAVTSILNYSILSCFYSCMWCAIMTCYLQDILWGVLPCHSLRLLYRIWTLQICCQHCLLSLSSYTNNQPPCGPFSRSSCILFWIKVSVFFLHYSNLPINLTICGHTCHTCCMCPWRTCSCFFIHILVIEIYLQVLVSLVYCFHPIMSSKTNEFISCDPCMPSLRCWHSKILLRVHILRLGNRKLVPSYNLHISHILP